MKEFSFIGIILIVFYCSGLSQQETLVVQYQLDYQYDKDDSKSIETTICHLIIRNNKSKFSPITIHAKDSLQQFQPNRSPEDYMRFKKNNPLPRVFKYNVLKDLTTNQMQIFTQVDVTTFVTYKQIIFPMKWDIYGEKKEINGYECILATTNFAGRNYAAWFTKEIPIPEGPYKFGGLPGLILELQDSENHYNFSLQSLNTTNSNRWMDVYDMKDAPVDYERIESTHMVEYENRGFKNLSNRLPELGLIPMKNAKEAYERYQATFDSFNNFIERE